MAAAGEFIRADVIRVALWPADADKIGRSFRNFRSGVDGGASRVQAESVWHTRRVVQERVRAEQVVAGRASGRGAQRHTGGKYEIVVDDATRRPEIGIRNGLIAGA